LFPQTSASLAAEHISLVLIRTHVERISTTSVVWKPPADEVRARRQTTRPLHQIRFSIKDSIELRPAVAAGRPKPVRGGCRSMKLPIGCEAVGGRSIPIAESDLPDLLIAFEGDKL